MCVIRVRGSINYINILFKSQGRVYKDPKRGRMHVLISLPPMEIYLVAAEQWGPLRCSISWHKQLKLYSTSECSAENVTRFFFLNNFVINYCCTSLFSFTQSIFNVSASFCTETVRHFFSLVLLSKYLPKSSGIPAPLHFTPFYFIRTLEGLITARCRGKTI